MRNTGAAIALLLIGSLVACGGTRMAPTTPTQPTSPQTPAAPAPPPPPPPPTLAKTAFVAFGDSLTEGVFGTETGVTPASFNAGLPTAYPYQLGLLLSARYTAQTITVSNDGKAGERAADALPRLNSVLDAEQPQVLLLLEGANDIGTGSTIQDATDRVEDLTRAALNRGIIVMLATYPPERPGPSTQPGVPPRGGNAALIPPFNAALKNMAANKGAMVVDLYPQFDVSLIGPDGLHPTAAGYARMAEIFFEAVQAAWDQPPRLTSR